MEWTIAVQCTTSPPWASFRGTFLRGAGCGVSSNQHGMRERGQARGTCKEGAAHRPLMRPMMRRRADRVVDGRAADQAAAVRYGRVRKGRPTHARHASMAQIDKHIPQPPRDKPSWHPVHLWLGLQVHLT